MKININLTEKEQIIRAIRENPGIMARELKTLLPHIEHKVIVKHLRRMSGTVAGMGHTMSRVPIGWSATTS